MAEYEGPLDLLLHLLSKHKVNIWDIEIASLLGQYMEQIRQWQEQDLEVASEFLEMASRLVYIKTLSLLPKREEEEAQAKAELVGQLVEYQACRQAAALLRGMGGGEDLFGRPPMPSPGGGEYRLRHEAVVLTRAYLDAMGKGQRRLPPRQESFSPLVAKPVISVTSRIIHILRGLHRGTALGFHALFSHSRSRSEMVATFLAVLELVKSKRITVGEDGEKIAFRPRGEQDEKGEPDGEH